MKVIVLLIAAVALAIATSDAEYRKQFNDFKTKHTKSYPSPTENEHRFRIFKVF